MSSFPAHSGAVTGLHVVDKILYRFACIWEHCHDRARPRRECLIFAALQRWNGRLPEGMAT
jgi:hypothetical protein